MTCVTLDICAFKILSTVLNLQPMFLNSKHEDFTNPSHRLWELHLSSSSKIHFIKWKSYRGTVGLPYLINTVIHCQNMTICQIKTLYVFTKSKEQIILSRWIEMIPVSWLLFLHSLDFFKCGIKSPRESFEMEKEKTFFDKHFFISFLGYLPKCKMVWGISRFEKI